MYTHVHKKKSVFIGLSGGVDSSVAAHRLLKAGYEVTGVFIKVWHPDFLACDWEEERLSAMRVAATLKIPFLTFDASDVYKREVADYMIEEYRKGHTPNPDIMCNQHVKFGAFLKFALAHGARYIATGHYAQIEKVSTAYHLKKGRDAEKDQTYFLWRLTQKELAHVLFPVGDSTKSTIRKEASARGLPTAERRDSQGVCFLGQLDMQSFLSHYIEEKSGEVRNTSDEVIGEHPGVHSFTFGQRHGFTILNEEAESRPHYVYKKDIKRNIIYVDHTLPTGEGVTLVLRASSYVCIPPREKSEVCIMTRYRERPKRAIVHRNEDDTVTLKVLEELSAPTPGQSCVLYTGSVCLGGGIIDNVIM